MSSVATIEEIKARIEGLLKAQEETSKQLKETDRQFKETDQKIRESQMKTDKQLRQTDKQLRKLESLFTGNWDKLIESLVDGILVKLLNDRGIEVDKTLGRIDTRKKIGPDYEVDILAVNGEEVVVVEVKTTLRPKDVDYFIKKLGLFKQVFSEYSDKRVYGAVAYLKEEAHCARYSERQGLFVIRATGDSASIVNKEDFKPKTF